jgi:16S rRNA processing protein RimM
VDEPTVTVGRIAKPHGVRGELSVQNRSDNPERWIPGAVFFDATGHTYTVRTVRPHGERLLVAFEEIGDRTAAEAVTGTELLIPESWLPELPEGRWWSHQVEGLAVVTESGRALGTIDEVLPYPAQDLWRVVADDGTETLVPAVDDLVVSVDIDGGRAVVRDLPGLTAPDVAG